MQDRPGRLGNCFVSGAEAVIGTGQRTHYLDTGSMDHAPTTSTTASDVSQALRSSNAQSRLQKASQAAHRRHLPPQHRCCSADRNGYAVPVSRNTATLPLLDNPPCMKHRETLSRLSTPTATITRRNKEDLRSRRLCAGVAVQSTNHERSIDQRFVNIPPCAKLRSRSKSRSGLVKDVPPQVFRLPRTQCDDFVISDHRTQNCPCMVESHFSQDIGTLIWQLHDIREQVNKLEEKLSSLMEYNSLSPHHPGKQCYCSEPKCCVRKISNLNGRHRVYETRQFHDAALGKPSRSEDETYPVDLENYWMQSNVVYDAQEVEWEEDSYLGAAHVYSQPVETVSTKQNNENLLSPSQNEDARSTSAVLGEPKRVSPGDKRNWHLQQARTLLRTLPSQDSTEFLNDDKRADLPSEDKKDMLRSAGETKMAPMSSKRATTELNSTKIANHTHKAGGKVSRTNTGQGEVFRSLTRQNTTALEMPHVSTQLMPTVSKGEQTNNTGRKSSTTPKSDTSASCFSGYFPAAEYTTTSAKPLCVPVLGLDSKALPSAAWFSGEHTQGETYGS